MDVQASPNVTIEDPERANLLELILASLLERRLAQPQARTHARAVNGDVVVQAGAMRAMLRFGDREIAVAHGNGTAAAAYVRGSLAALIDAALGRRRVANVLRGELRVTGSPRALWHLLALLRAGGGTR